MQLNRVLIGIDFSAPSLATARWVAHHFAPRAELILVHVIPTPRVPHYLAFDPSVNDQPTAEEEKALLGGLMALATSLAGARATADVRVGDPTSQLVRAASELGADVIAVGRSGQRGGTGPWRHLGTTADRLVRCAAVPVLVAARAPALTPGSVFTAVDDGEIGDEVLRWGVFLARKLHARLTALHVVDDAVRAFAPRPVRIDDGDVSGYESTSDIDNKSTTESASDPTSDITGGTTNGITGSIANSITNGITRESTSDITSEPGERMVDEAIRDAAYAWLREKLAAAGYNPVRAEIAIALGDPRHELLAAAGCLDAELLIIGRQGTDGSERTGLGSIARAALRPSSRAVLVVPPPIVPPHPTGPIRRGRRVKILPMPQRSAPLSFLRDTPSRPPAAIKAPRPQPPAPAASALGWRDSPPPGPLRSRSSPRSQRSDPSPPPASLARASTSWPRTA